jgi:hypothetical protein
LWILGREEDEHPKQRKILPPKFIKRKSCPTDEGLSSLSCSPSKYPQVPGSMRKNKIELDLI